MKKIIRGRYLIFALWLVATVVLVALQPDINAILRFRGQQPMGKDNPSMVASEVLSKMDTAKGNSDILVFYSKDTFSDADMKQIGDGVRAIADSKTTLGISNILDPFSMPDAKSNLISEDNTTLMVSFKLDKGSREVADIQKELEGKLTGIRAEHYFSGEDFISEDYLKLAMNGVEKSAVLTVIFILVVLMIMFRSVVTPLVSLVAVAFSYLVSMGIAAQLIDKAGFPITSLTQMLLVLILFGIGTDYNILLFNRFKEELGHGSTVDEAISKTYSTAGKTIAYSILTVFFAFLCLIFAKSPIYQSGVVVVIGVTVLLLQILTLTPFFMKILGPRLFWPTKKDTGHHENRYWAASASFASRHPVVSVLVVLALIVPTLVFYQQKLNSDNIAELGDKADSSKGFLIVAEHFGKGQAMPSTVVIESDKALDTKEALAALDQLTTQIRKVEGVSRVVSVTQPQGKPIEEFYVSGQTKSVTDGLGKSRDGIDQINDGLRQATGKLAGADFSQVGKMADGTAQLQSGVTALSAGLKQIETGLAAPAGQSQSLLSGIQEVRLNLTRMSGAVKTLSENYDRLQGGYQQMGSHYQGAAQALLGVKQALGQMQGMTVALAASEPKLANDPAYQGLTGTLAGLLKSLESITPEGIAALNDNYNAATAGFAEANKGLAAMGAGMDQMAGGLSAIEAGLGKAANGMDVIVTNLKGISDGLGQMKTGQQQLAEGLNGFSAFGTRMGEINTGLGQISDGLKQTNAFLSQMNGQKTFFIPDEALRSDSFKKAMDSFMTHDRNIAKMMVVLDADPYSPEALASVEKISNLLNSAVKGTVLDGSKIGVAGPSAMSNDLIKVLNTDLNRMTLIVLIGIFLVLILVIRSIWEPLVITASLMGAYYAGMFALNFVFLNMKGLPGVQSFVPFFAFIIIVALGVDYSIFLMMRFKEYPHMSHKEAIVLASRHTGGVVMSAVIILGGTFATLIPSGFSILVQLALAVIVGLIVLCFLMLPVFLPAMISLSSMVRKRFGEPEDTPL